MYFGSDVELKKGTKTRQYVVIYDKVIGSYEGGGYFCWPIEKTFYKYFGKKERAIVFKRKLSRRLGEDSDERGNPNVGAITEIKLKKLRQRV